VADFASARIPMFKNCLVLIFMFRP